MRYPDVRKPASSRTAQRVSYTLPFSLSQTSSLPASYIQYISFGVSPSTCISFVVCRCHPILMFSLYLPYNLHCFIVLFLPNTPKRRRQNGPKTSARARADHRISIEGPLFMNCKRWSSHLSMIFPRHLLYWRKSLKSKRKCLFCCLFYSFILLMSCSFE